MSAPEASGSSESATNPAETAFEDEEADFDTNDATGTGDENLQRRRMFWKELRYPNTFKMT